MILLAKARANLESKRGVQRPHKLPREASVKAKVVLPREPLQLNKSTRVCPTLVALEWEPLVVELSLEEP
jgi:hypothetical protein